MDAPLFRHQAIDARRRRPDGDPLELAAPGHAALVVLAMVVVVCAGWLLGTVDLPHRATVRGYLAPEAGVVRMRSITAGTVTALMVQEGDAVVAGQPLLRLEARRSTGTTPDVAATASAGLRRTHDALLDQRRMAQSSLEADLVVLARRADALRREIGLLDAQRTTARERAELAARRGDELAPVVAQGLLPMAALLQQLDRAEELRLDALRIEQQMLERSRLLGDVDAERGARGRQMRAQVAELDATLARSQVDALEAEQRNDSILSAPIAGRVLRLGARPGTSTHPGEVLVVLAPATAPLRAVLLVPTRDAGMLARGQPVVLRLDAFPYQRFGVRRATVLKVGAGVVLPGEREMPIAPAEPVFEVLARLDSDEIAAYGRRWPLRTDLTFEADVQIERTTLIERLLDPLRAFGRRDG